MIQGNRSEAEYQKLEIIIYLEVPYTKILGVFGKDIHLLTHGFKYLENDKEDEFECVLIIPEDVYLKEWKKWIDGKRDYCERFNHYCGVMGYTHPINAELVGEIKVNIWNEEKEDYDLTPLSAFKATEFTERPDFEHG